MRRRCEARRVPADVRRGGSVRKREIFADALAITDPVQRRLFIEAACAGDRELQSEIEELLAWHALAPALLGDPAAAPAAAHAAGPSSVARERAHELPPPFVPGVVLGTLIGKGGAGYVYEGWQDAPRRRVAVKLVRTALEGQAATRRALREGEILARLDHPGIARVYAVHEVDWGGATVPAIVMELVEGAMALTVWSSAGSVPPRRRVEVFAAVCDAVGHAHRLGIVHRDLKPGNILVDRVGHPKVIDFDWARCQDTALGVESLGTRSGQLIGTHAYMSPEQFEGGTRADSRSDVWALGMVLFELLAGRTAFDFRGKTVYDAAATVRDTPAPPVTRFAAGVPRDLAAIVATCLDQRPERRYADAGALAADVARHLAGEPIVACPAGFVDGVLQLARRHRAAAVATATALASLVATTVGIAMFAGQADRDRVVAERARAAESVALDAARAARDRAEGAAREARWGEYVANVRQLAHPRETANPRGVAPLFAATAGLAGELGIGPPGGLPLELAILRAGFDGASAREQLPESIGGLAWSPGGETVALGGNAGGVFLAAAHDPRNPRRLDAHRSGLAAIAFSADGRKLVTGAADGAARIWDVASGAALADLPATTARVGDAVFSPDGAVVAMAGDDGRVRILDALSGAVRHTVAHRRGRVRVVRFRPGDGATLATGSLEGDSVLWDARNGMRIAAFGGRRTRVPAVAFSADGALLAVPGEGEGVAIVDGLTGERLHHLPGPDVAVTGLSFAGGGALLAVVSGDAPVHLWDAATGRRVAVLDGHRSAVTDAAFSPDGRWLATVSSDRAVRIYQTDTGLLRATMRGHEASPSHLAWSPDGSRLATTGGSVLRFWEHVGDGGPTVLRGPGGQARWVAFSADGGTLVVACHGSVATWDVATATQRGRLAAPSREESFFALSPATSRGPELVAAPDGAGGVGIWPLDGGGRAATLPGTGAVHAMAFAPRDGRLVIATADGSARLVDPVEGASLSIARLVPGLLRAAVSADGTTVVGGGEAGEVAVWHPAADEVLHPVGHRGKVRALLFRPGHRQFLSIGQEGRVVLRDQATGEPIREIATFREWVTGVAFSPDGHRLALATISGSLGIHALDGDPAAVHASGHDQRINAVSWSPDGTRLVTGSEDHTVRVWDTATGVQLADLDGHAAPVLDVAISADGRLVASASADGTVRLWGRSSAEIGAARRDAGR
ncbi:MAG: serine/threonine protein kinase [Planctomycetes bacterium]|nr:serine/threonine protein kinase [Planctomycetota bacterium]